MFMRGLATPSLFPAATTSTRRQRNKPIVARCSSLPRRCKGAVAGHKQRCVSDNGLGRGQLTGSSGDRFRGGRMPKCCITRMNHTGFTFSDLDRAAAFFRDVLGFSISATTRQSGPAVERITGVAGAEIDIAFATGPGCTIELMRFINPVSPRAFDLRPCDPGFAHIAFEVEDIDATYAAIEAAGFRSFSHPQVVPAGPRKGGKNNYAEGPEGTG